MPKPSNLSLIPSAETIMELSIEELCTVYHTTPEFVIELIAYGTLEPKGTSVAAWRFDANQIQIVRTAQRLHHDLEVNHAGIAVAIDLLHQVKELHEKLEILQKHLLLDKNTRSS